MDGKFNYFANRILKKSRNLEVGGTAASTNDKDQVGGKRSILVAFWGFWGLLWGQLGSRMRALAPLDVGEGLRWGKGDLRAIFGPP